MEFRLDSHPKNKEFDVPNGYFDSLSEQILSHVQSVEHKRFIVRKRWITAISVAASLALILVAGFLFYDISHTPTTAPIATTITPKESIPQTEIITQESTQDEILLAQNQISNPVTLIAAKKSYSSSPKEVAKEQSHANELSAEELDDIEHQMLENYDEEIVFNDWWEM